MDHNCKVWCVYTQAHTHTHTCSKSLVEKYSFIFVAVLCGSPSCGLCRAMAGQLRSVLDLPHNISPFQKITFSILLSYLFGN